MTRHLNIAMLGLKGLPATWGGVERHVEELGSRLADRGHQVTVFCRTNYADVQVARYRGMRLVHLPTVDQKHLDAIVHSVNASVRCVGRRYDVVHYHGVGPGLAAPLVRLGRPGTGVALTVHGLDGDRAKWGTAARNLLRTATWMSARVPHSTVTVSRALAEHYRQVYGAEATYIPNGVEPVPPRAPGDYLDKLGLRPGGYALFVGRLVPEKAPDLLVEAYRRVPGEHRLVLAGGSSHTDEFVARLRALAAPDPRVVLPGYVHGSDLEELYSNAAVFVIPSLLEGLPLTLLEAVSYSVPVLASAIPPHVEVLQMDRPGARIVPPGDTERLREALERALTDDGKELEGAAEVHQEVVPRYSWDAATDQLEDLYLRLARRS
jgi:glycosyltransferase involved in cell wall biosynthesis